MPDRTLAAFAMILGYAVIIGFTDNFVITIAEAAGLWQFHATRSAMGLALLAAGGLVLGMRLRPRRWRGVVARSVITGTAMVLYFGALAFLPVAQVAAGLFTAPVFVLLIERLVYGRAISGLQVLAVAVGFVGVLMVLGPSAMAGASVAAAVPVAAGALYAMGNIATRRWCEGEAATALVAGFFAVLAVYGLLGMAVLSLWPLPAPPGPEGFVLRGPVVPDADFWFWTFVQAAGSLVAVAMMIRAYQVAQAGRVAVFEYVILPASAFWSWAIWGQRLDGLAVAGMVLIVAAGVLIATASAQGEGAASGA